VLISHAIMKVLLIMMIMALLAGGLPLRLRRRSLLHRELEDRVGRRRALAGWPALRGRSAPRRQWPAGILIIRSKIIPPACCSRARRDKSADPAKIAAKLGFRGSSWKTLETGGGELDYHFLDPGTAAFGLNNYVYILKKQ